MKKITQKIVAAKVAVPANKEVEELNKTVVQVLNSERTHPGEWVMPSTTYKIKSRFCKENVYCHIIDDNEGMFSIFFNTKDADVAESLQAISVLASAVLRRTNNPSFIVEELKSIHGSRGYLRPPRDGEEKGWFVGSLAAEVGGIIDYHLKRKTKLDEERKQILEQTDEAISKGKALSDKLERLIAANALSPDTDFFTTVTNANYDQCPECRGMTYLKEAGCGTCTNCGYSRCS